MKKLLAFAVVLIVMALPAQAMAQSPTQDTYDDSSIIQVDPSDPGDPAATGDPASSGTGEGTGGSLPFTGLDIALIAAIAAGMLVLGVGVRRLARPPDAA